MEIFGIILSCDNDCNQSYRFIYYNILWSIFLLPNKVKLLPYLEVIKPNLVMIIIKINFGLLMPLGVMHHTTFSSSFIEPATAYKLVIIGEEKFVGAQCSSYWKAIMVSYLCFVFIYILLTIINSLM